MAISKEMRLLANKWGMNRHWPKRLEWLEILNVRGWSGQRIDFNFPFVAIVGENGVGKSTILQAIASVYKSPEDPYFASDFFPDTPWDKITDATIRCSVREGDRSRTTTVRKPSTRWRGNPERRDRAVRYIDLRRTQPIGAQLGYSKIAKPQHKETRVEVFDADKLARYSEIIGRPYNDARYAWCDADTKRAVPVVSNSGAGYSGFHQGAGETTLADLIKVDLPNYGVILIDEIETSLHPRSQRRLMRDLAEMCRVKELQIIVTTHSPYVLDELPPAGRMCVMMTGGQKSLITGVSPSFAMTQMDEEQHPEIDLYVEDDRALTLLQEIIVAHHRELMLRCKIIAYGAASVGQALGMMVSEKRFPRPSLVFLDADQEPAKGCILLPGDDAPERVVFQDLKAAGWLDIAARLARPPSEVADALERAMTLTDHHDWVRGAADKLVVGSSDTLWRAMAGAWATKCLPDNEAKRIVQSVEAALAGG